MSAHDSVPRSHLRVGQEVHHTKLGFARVAKIDDIRITIVSREFGTEHQIDAKHSDVLTAALDNLHVGQEVKMPGGAIGRVLGFEESSYVRVCHPSGERISLYKTNFAPWTAPPERSLPPPAPPPLEFLSYSDMLRMAEPEWLVPGLLPSGASALMFSRSDTYKSFFAIDVACSIGTATPWHGTPVSPGRVVYIATEGGSGVGALRIPGWMDAHDIPSDRRNAISLYPRPIALDNPKSVDKLIDTIWHTYENASGLEWLDDAGARDIALQLLVIDIFGASMAGSEVTDETARSWVQGVNRIIDETCATVLTVAHTGWGDETRARMHTHFWGSFDTRIKAERSRESMTATLRINRHKDAESSGEWSFRVEEVPTPGGATTLIPRLLDAAATRHAPQVSGKERAALEALRATTIAQGRRITEPKYPASPVVEVEQWRAACEHELTDSSSSDTRSRTFRRVRDSLVEKGLVGQLDGYAWEISQ